MSQGLENENKHKIAQALLLFAEIALFILIYFSVFGSGVLLDIVLGFTSMFLVILFSSIFVEKKGLYKQLEDVGENILLVLPISGLGIIAFAALGYMTSGVVLSGGIQLFLMGVFNLLRFLNENLPKSTETESNFLKLFYKTENTTLAISILNCLALGVMVLCGYCDLAFAISFGAPLLGVSLILKLGMLLYGKLKKYKQTKNPVEAKDENKDKEKGEKSENKDNDKKYNPEDNRIPQSDKLDKENEQ